jgi:hypothetical protein
MTKLYSEWRKSHHSNPDGDCVELARATDGTIGVRDSKAPLQSPILELSREDWASFVSHVRRLVS